MIKILTISLSLSLVLLTSNCHSVSSSPTSKKENAIATNFKNHTDSSAKKIKAKYGGTYNLSGNVIVQYSDFDIRLLSTQINGSDTLCKYEITSKTGLEKDEITSNTAKPERKHFYIEDMHFYFHSDSPGKLNIYIPAILIASHQSSFTNPL